MAEMLITDSTMRTARVEDGRLKVTLPNGEVVDFGVVLGPTVTDADVAAQIATPGTQTAAELALASIADRKMNTRAITSKEWGLEAVFASPSDRAKAIQEFWNYTAANGYTAVMLPGEYVVDRFADPIRVDGILTVPEGADIEFRYGCKITRAPFVEGTVVAQTRVLIIGAQSTGSTLSGTLEIDGAGDSVTWYNEHNHCLFIYNAKNVDARGLRFIGRNAMGDCLSFSGGGNTPATGATENVWLGIAELYDARRKSLVIEATVNCGIEHAYIDNSVSGCFDYEPFTVLSTGRVLSFYLGTLYSLGPIDLTAGTTRATMRASLSGESWTVVARAGQTTAPYVSYGVNLKLNRLVIDGRAGGLMPSLVSLNYSGVFDVRYFEAITPDTNPTTSASVTVATPTGSPPFLMVDTMFLHGATAIGCSVTGTGKIGTISVFGRSAPSSRLSFASPLAVTDANGSGLTVGNIEFVDAYNSQFLVGNSAATTDSLVQIGSIRVLQGDGRVTPAIVSSNAPNSVWRMIIGDMSIRGGGAAALCVPAAGTFATIRVRNTPEEMHYHGPLTTWTPEGVITASQGARVLNVIGGRIFVKTTSASVNTGWRELALV